MFNEYKKGHRVIVYGPGQKLDNNGKCEFYKNKPAIIIERDPYYKDYCVRFKDGSEDWILAEFLRKPYERKNKGVKI